MTEEVKAYVLELMELCLELGYALDYNPHTLGITIWDYAEVATKEAILVTTAYLDEVLTPELMGVEWAVQVLKAYDKLKKDLE